MSQRWQQGYLYRANSSWHIRFCVTAIVDGQPKRVQKSKRLCDGDLSDKTVKRAFSEFMTRINDQPSSQTEDLPIAQFWGEIYQPFVVENLKPSTVSGYQHLWNHHLKQHFGAGLLRDYRTPMGTVFLTNLAKTYGKRTVQHIRGLASGLFMHAVNLGHIESNPWHDVKVLGKQREVTDTESYSLEEIENVISALVEHPQCQLIMALSFFAGLRRGEIAGLQWNDLDDQFIHVRRAVGAGIVGTPKTKKSIRSVPIIEPVRVLLLLWRAKYPDGVWMFPNERGTPANLKDLSRRLIRPALQRAACPWKGYQAGRRGLGTTLRALTGNSNAGRDLLGHTTTQTTQKHYESDMPQEALAGMKLLEAKSSK
jgi:integrase